MIVLFVARPFPFCISRSFECSNAFQVCIQEVFLYFKQVLLIDLPASPSPRFQTSDGILTSTCSSSVAADALIYSLLLNDRLRSLAARATSCDAWLYRSVAEEASSYLHAGFSDVGFVIEIVNLFTFSGSVLPLSLLLCARGCDCAPRHDCGRVLRDRASGPWKQQIRLRKRRRCFGSW